MCMYIYIYIYTHTYTHYVYKRASLTLLDSGTPHRADRDREDWPKIALPVL